MMNNKPPPEFDPQSLIPRSPEEPDQQSLLAQLESDEQATRLEAIDALSRVGDEEALEVLREQLRLISREHQALIISIGTLRWRLSGASHASLDQHR